MSALFRNTFIKTAFIASVGFGFLPKSGMAQEKIEILIPRSEWGQDMSSTGRVTSQAYWKKQSARYGKLVIGGSKRDEVLQEYQQTLKDWEGPLVLEDPDRRIDYSIFKKSRPEASDDWHVEYDEENHCMVSTWTAQYTKKIQDTVYSFKRVEHFYDLKHTGTACSNAHDDTLTLLQIGPEGDTLQETVGTYDGIGKSRLKLVHRFAQASADVQDEFKTTGYRAELMYGVLASGLTYEMFKDPKETVKRSILKPGGNPLLRFADPEKVAASEKAFRGFDCSPDFF